MEDIIKIQREGYKFFIHKKLYGSMIKYKQKFLAVIDDTSPLTFIRKDDNGDSGISLTLRNNYTTTKVMQYSLDTVNWKNYTYGTEIKLHKDEFVLFRSPDEVVLPMTVTSSADEYDVYDILITNYLISKFNTSGNGIYECYGRVSSLFNDNVETSGSLVGIFSETRITRAPMLDLTNYLTAYKFCATFKNCILLKDIPFTFDVDYSGSIGAGLLWHMFYGCASLETHPPIIKNSTDSENMRLQMFCKCTSLKNIPPISLAGISFNKPRAYAYMYAGCTGLTNLSDFWPRALFTITSSSATYLFLGMFMGCTNLKYFSTQINIYNMAGQSHFVRTFMNCSSLIQGPNFSINLGINNAFQETFKNCTSLVNAPNFEFGYVRGTNTFNLCFYGCTNLKTGGTLTYKTTTYYDYIETLTPVLFMFYRMYMMCTKLETPPIFNFFIDSYQASMFLLMFSNCSSLTYAPKIIVLDTTINANNIFNEMFYLSAIERAHNYTFKNITAGESIFSGMYNNCSNLKYTSQILQTNSSKASFKWMFSSRLFNKIYTARSSWDFSDDSYTDYINTNVSEGTVVTTLTEAPSSYSKSTIPPGWTQKHGAVERYYWDLQKGEELNLGIYLRDIYDITLGVGNSLSGRNEFMRFYEESLDWTYSLKTGASTTTSTKMGIYPSFTKSSTSSPVEELIRNKVHTFTLPSYFCTYNNNSLFTNIKVIDQDGAVKGNVGTGSVYQGSLATFALFSQFFNNAQIILSCPDTTYKSTCLFFLIRTIHGVFIPHKDGRHLINFTTNELIDTGHLFTAVKYTGTVTDDKICGIDFYKWMYADDE